jgi:sigma-B regulation protein RsbU (phosphoserine phosphatase)
VYTDGVTEAHNAQNEMFGEGLMLDALNLQPDADPQEIDKNIHDGIAAFVQDAEQFDDTTMLCLKYFGPQESAGEKNSDE